MKGMPKRLRTILAMLEARPVLNQAMLRLSTLSMAAEQIRELEPDSPERDHVLGYLDACQRRVLRAAGVHEEYVTLLVDSAAEVSARTGR